MTDKGMSRAEAEALAVAVSGASGQPTTVEPDGPSFIVTVVIAESGKFTLHDEADWEWLRPRILGE